MTRVPLEAFVRACGDNHEVELVGLCDAGKSDATTVSRRLKDGARRAVRGAFNSRAPKPGPGPGVIQTAGRRWGLRVLTPAGRDVNSSRFADEVRAMQPNALLSLGCIQIFGAEFLSLFRTAVNFHNGLLPEYRGLNATAWSLYNGEAETGYSFHHITPGIDEGNVIFEGRQPVTPDLTADDADWNKCVAAAAAAKDVIAAMVAGASGRPQGAGSYYSRRDRNRLCRIERPESLSTEEVRRRLKCFGLIEVKIDGRWWEVTEVAETGAPSFRTLDGRLAVRRAMFLPPLLYRLYRAL